MKLKKKAPKKPQPEEISEFTRDMFNLNNKVKISLGGNSSITYDVARDLKEIIDKKHPDWKIVSKLWVLDSRHPTHYIVDIRGFTINEFINELIGSKDIGELLPNGWYRIWVNLVDDSFILNKTKRSDLPEELFTIRWNQRIKFFM